MRGICKYFPGVRALENVDFTLHSGEVHALVGENGAGKSTLIKVLTGVHAKDGGKIAMEGRPISPSSPLEAMKCGISTVYQEVNLCPNLSVAENIFIGREPKKAGGIDIGTKTEIQKMVIQLAREQHMSIIFISSEIDEMTRTCTRLAVLRDRRKVAELTGDDINSDRVMAAIAGGA